MNQYTLFLSLRSPFARRINIALKNLDLPHRLEAVDVFQHNPSLHKVNPLALVPALITPEGKSITDSATILEYLDELTGRIWPHELNERTEMRQVSTWCAGVMQNTVSYFLETKFHAVPEATWAKEYIDNIEATYSLLEGAPESIWVKAGKLTQAALDLGVAIEYQQMRIPEIGSAEKFPSLNKVFLLCKSQPAFQETAPPKM